MINHIDSDACIACKTCIEICMRDVLRWSDDESKPVPTYYEDCQTCFNCEINCPSGAIYVHSQHKERVPPW
jgi:NAD-dependent dihydropyrimidine dehydrogenase PreA subunit